jgi:hypothetical protein
MSWSGKRSWGEGGQEQPAPAKKKKKESKTERILRQVCSFPPHACTSSVMHAYITLFSDWDPMQAKEAAEAAGNASTENDGASSAPKAHAEPTKSAVVHSENTKSKARIPERDSARGKALDKDEKSTKSSSHESNWPQTNAYAGSHAKHSESSERAPARATRPHENQRSYERDNGHYKKTKDDRDEYVSQAADKGASGKKKKESKVERLRRQMAGNDDAFEAADKASDHEGQDDEEKSERSRRKRNGSKDQDSSEDMETEEPELGGWAATAQSEGLFNEGEGLMALTSSKDKHAHKPVSGAQKQALLREVIPQWMKTPLDISSTPESSARDVGLDPRLIDALEKGGFASFFPVQSAVISQLLCTRPGGRVEWSGSRDVCVCAPTGSGKTLAFCVPIVQTLMTRVVPRLRALVVEPSRDLAAQVFAVMSALCACCDLRVCLAAGQVSYAEEKAAMLPHCDILVATPGRLTEHLLHTPHFTAQHLRYVFV